MRRNIICFALILAVCLVFGACGTEPVGTTENPSTTIPETLPPQTTAPTDHTLEDYAARMQYDPEGNDWLNRAMAFVFEDPAELDPLTWLGTGVGAPVTIYDLDSVEREYLVDLDVVYENWYVLTVAEANRILEDTFGKSLEEFTWELPDNWFYLEEKEEFLHGYDAPEQVGTDYTRIQDFTVDSVQVQPDGTIAVTYTPMEQQHYLYLQPMVLTLRETEGGSVVASNQMKTEGMDYLTLTKEQIDQVNEAFSGFVNVERNGETYVAQSASSCILVGGYFDDPREIRLHDMIQYFGYVGVVEEYEDLTEEEFNTILHLEQWPFGTDFQYELRYAQQVPITKVPTWVADAVLEHFTGIHLEDLYDREDVVYLEEYDSYYSFASDMGWGVFPCIRGRIYDDRVELYSSDSVMTLVNRDGRYVIASYCPLA